MILPSKLTNEPLIDAIFECRFTATHPATSVLPGLLFSLLKGTKNTQKLPASEIPEQFRDADANLRYAPLIRIEWDRFVILVGDRSLAIASKIPYVGWGAFKPTIIDVIEKSGTAGIIETIERFSLKYVDILPNNLGSSTDLIDLQLRIGPHPAEDATQFQLRTEFAEGGFIHIIQLASAASASIPGSPTREGTALDIDSIAPGEMPFQQFVDTLSVAADNIHLENKKVFFSCLTKNAIEKLGPVYA